MSLLILFLFVTGCTTHSTSKRSVQPISSLAAKRGQSQQNGLLKVPGEIIHNSGEAFLWVVKELLSPFNALRKGMINTLGVTEESTMKEHSLPPSPYRD